MSNYIPPLNPAVEPGVVMTTGGPDNILTGVTTTVTAPDILIAPNTITDADMMFDIATTATGSGIPIASDIMTVAAMVIGPDTIIVPAMTTGGPDNMIVASDLITDVCDYWAPAAAGKVKDRDLARDGEASGCTGVSDYYRR